MPWHPIGRGRLAASALPLAPCVAFWRAAQSAQHRIEVPDSLLAYPNCALYAQCTDPLVGAFLFTVPFTDTIARDDLYEYASQQVDLQSPEPWSPQIPPGADRSQFRLCLTLAMRIKLLVQARRLGSLPDDLVCAWLDAHILLTLAIDALGTAPPDDSPAVSLLMARYAPAHYTALRQSDMPDLAAELERCNVFVDGIDTHREDAFVDLFSKALPRRYDSKDLVTKVADAATRNAGFAAFVRLMVAASQLGIYAEARTRPPFAVRRAVYQLHFFELDLVLRAHSTAVPLGGTAAAVRRAFATTQLEERVLEHLDDNEATHIEIHCLSYTQSLAHTYSGVAAPRRPKAPDATADGVVRRSRKKTLHSAVVQHTMLARAVGEVEDANQRAPLCAVLTAPCDGNGLLNQTTLRLYGRDQADDIAAALSGANTVARLVYERNCGLDVHEQRRAAGYVPADAAEPADAWAPIDYAVAVAGGNALVRPSDHVLPSEERLQGDALFFEWLTTSVSSWTGRARRTSTRGRRTTFLNQLPLVLAVREYIVFAMRRWCEPMRYALERLVRWETWEQGCLAAADTLRAKLTERCARPDWNAAFLLSDPYPYVDAAIAMPETQFDAHCEPFLDALLHRFVETSRGWHGKSANKAPTKSREPADTAPVDAVVPRETEVLLRHALRFWQYARSAPPAAEAPLEPYEHAQNRARPLDFVIEPVFHRDVAMTPAQIRDEFVTKARFPLSIFHASGATLDQFDVCRQAYAVATSAEQRYAALQEYVEWLAATSVYQYQLMYTYCRVVNRYVQIRSFQLPLHVAEHQRRALRNQNCMPTNAALPPHLLRGLVCGGCARVATFLPPADQRQATIAFGNDEVRVLTTPSDDEHVFAAVRARGNRPLPYESLQPADSWLSVLHHRARDAPPVYDRYCGPETGEASMAQLYAPETVGLRPLRMTESQYEARVRATFACDHIDRNAAPLDRRHGLALVASAPRQQMVARGRGRLGEMAFADALWREVDERMMRLGGAASGERSYLLMGHALPGTDPRFAQMRFACKTHSSRSESRKSRATARTSSLAEASAAAELLSDDDGEEAVPTDQDKASATRSARLLIKQCREANAGAIFAACGRELMIEVEYLGRALYFTGLDASRCATANDDDYVAICCDCLAATRSGDLRAIADRIVCTPCYTASRLCSGSVVQRTARGESIKKATTAVPNALSNDALQAVQGATRQLLFSPSYATLCSEVVALGTVCVMDQCKSVKSADTAFYGLEVLCDTNVGNEAFGFIYFCQIHARLYRALFNSPTRLPLSTVRYFMADSKRFANNVGMHGNFLETVMRGDARSTDDRTRTDLGKQIVAQKRGSLDQRRKQRKVALGNSARHLEQQERAAVERLLDAPPNTEN